MIDFSQIQWYLILGIKIAVAIVAGLIGWYLTPPLIAIVHRSIFRKAASKYELAAGRLIGAAGLGLLAFFLINLGWGGSGPGIGTPGDAAANRSKKPDRTDAKNFSKKPKERREILRVEMIPAREYQGDGRFYRVAEEQSPRTLESLRQFLDRNRDRFGKLQVIIYADSPTEEHSAVKELRRLASELDLDWEVPAKYHRLRKGEAKPAATG